MKIADPHNVPEVYFDKVAMLHGHDSVVTMLLVAERALSPGSDEKVQVVVTRLVTPVARIPEIIVDLQKIVMAQKTGGADESKRN